VRNMKISRFFLTYLISRLIVFVLTLLAAFSITFILLRLMPARVVEALLAQLSQQAQAINPEDFIKMRETLYEIFGLKGSFGELYLKFLYRFLTLDFGPSMIAFPTPVRDLIAKSLPWTLGLLTFTTLISWSIGNILGAVATTFEDRFKRTAKLLQGIAIVLYPIPYYIMAMVLVMLFCYMIPIFPLVGSIAIGTRITISDIITIIKASTLPALSIILINAFGWWFISSRALTLNILAEDFIAYAEFRGVPPKKILRDYVFRNIMLPQVTALGLALGSIFSGALLTEVIFSYPGLGFTLYRAVITGDYSTALGILSLSIIAISSATLILDISYMLLDPRVRYR